MCGICGIVDLGAPPPVDAVVAMRETLAHRGPDDQGLYVGDGVALGFRRLSILDLSPAGNQPFSSHDGRLHLVHNGEVYNYRELRRELERADHVFSTGTDTEVIVAAYAEWGEACVEHFNGMWAFAIWDERERKLFCARDRFGVKPFYYRVDGGRFAFASEPKALRVLGPLQPNLPVVREYLEQGWLDQGEETFFENVRRLPAAHTLTVGRDGRAMHRYWSLEERDPPSGDPVELVRELFLDSIRLRLRSDVAVGTCLSGGIDSSAIAVGVHRLFETEHENALAVGARQRTFTAYFDDAGFDERPYARAVVERTAAEPTWVSFGDRELVDDLPAIVEGQDEPFGSTSMVAQWYVMRAARRAGLTVMLDGQGGDEVLGGYRALVGHRLADLAASGRVSSLARDFAAFAPSFGYRGLAIATARPFAPDALTRATRARARGGASLVGGVLRGIRPFAAPAESVFGERLRRHQHLLLTQRGLPELLRYEDRNSMAHSLEARVPFLDYRFVELVFALPASELMGRGETKSVLRRALGDLLPPVVARRRDKLGFVTPTARFLRGALGDLAAELFASTAFRQRGWVDPAAATRALARVRTAAPAGVTAAFEVWRAVNLELWARRFLDT